MEPIFGCRTIDDFDSESESNVSVWFVVATVVVVVGAVVVGAVVVVVVVGAVTVILDFPMMSGCPLTGPKILPNHWPVGASGDIRNRNV